MDVGQLEAFQEVVRAGSFRRAAKALFLSHPALSERIHRLETEIGRDLFERGQGGVGLSPAGRAFLPYVTRVLDIQREGREAVLSSAVPPPEELRVAATPTVTTYFLPGALADLRRQMPVDLRVLCGRTAAVLAMVLRQGADVGVIRLTRTRSLVLSHRQIEVVALYSEPEVLVTYPGHPLAQRREASILEVAREPVVLYTGASFYAMLERRAIEAGLSPRVHMKLHGIEMAKRMVERGLGVSFIPLSALKEALRTGDLARVPLRERCEPQVETVALVKHGAPLSAGACTLLNALVEAGASL